MSPNESDKSKKLYDIKNISNEYQDDYKELEDHNQSRKSQKEMMMGQTIRDLGSTINDAHNHDEFQSDEKNAQRNSEGKSMGGEDYKNNRSNEKTMQMYNEFGQDEQQLQQEQALHDGMAKQDDDEEVIDIDNPE